MINMNFEKIQTLGDLKKAGYISKSIKQELRDNLLRSIKENKPIFEGVLGYEHTVIPDVERAILSKHNILFLGLRGQAKTKMARMMVQLLDEYIPIIAGSEVNDDPFNPISYFGKTQIETLQDDTPISWLHRSERMGEKLATPDVSVADLIGDLDPIKAANLRLSYADERVIHYGIIPRFNRCIFIINELPDLQARIQVALFNILQENDIQIRGFKWRFHLDMEFVFTANPEDYTNRGSIVTPLKDRIESQILTHYPTAVDISRKITEQEADTAAQLKMVHVPTICRDLVEQIAIEARQSEFVDQKSGVSARMTIAAFETVCSSAELRAIKNHQQHTTMRIADFANIYAAITGKVELVYEGEQEGPRQVAENLLSRAIKSLFLQYFPHPEKSKKQKQQKESIYASIRIWFEQGNFVEVFDTQSDQAYKNALEKIPGLKSIVEQYVVDVPPTEIYTWMELLLHGLAASSVIGKFSLHEGIRFGDVMLEMLRDSGNDDDGLPDLKDLFNG